VALVEFLLRLDNQQVENTYYVEGSVALEPGDLSDISDVAETWVGDEYLPLLSDDLTCIGVKVTDLTTDTSGTFTNFFPTPLAGSLTGGTSPANVAFVVKRLTAGRGRSSRGRVYVPGIARVSMPSTNLITSTLAGNLVSAWNILGTMMSSAGYQPVVISRQHNNAPRTTALIQNISGWSYTDLTVDSQRRRLPGRGV
jgi:hypothetical protein